MTNLVDSITQSRIWKSFFQHTDPNQSLQVSHRMRLGILFATITFTLVFFSIFILVFRASSTSINYEYSSLTLQQALILGIVQGATEYIPVSSSAHLVLVPWLLGWPDPSFAFEVLVQWGTLAGRVCVFLARYCGHCKSSCAGACCQETAGNV